MSEILHINYADLMKGTHVILLTLNILNSRIIKQWYLTFLSIENKQYR